jgi:hypothetical protein
MNKLILLFLFAPVLAFAEVDPLVEAELQFMAFGGGLIAVGVLMAISAVRVVRFLRDAI